MKCILMNKDTEILVAEYIEGTGTFSEIYEIRNIEYAPLILQNKYLKDNIILEDLSIWFKGRGIPNFRDNLRLLLDRLSVMTPESIIDKAFGLSLSDQYWLKPFDSNINHDDINFFDHDFDISSFVDATFSNHYTNRNSELTFKTPNNTTDGALRKAWIIEDNKRYLLKSGYKSEILQPFNEVLASEICKRLSFDYVNYDIDILKEKIVSKCPCFITKDTELISAYQILYNVILKENKENAYEEYIKILESHNIENVREKLENMYILDFLIMNEDRHLNNFGIIRDVNTLKWIDVAPIFDNGMSLNVPYYDEEEVITAGEGRFFYNVVEFDEIIKIVKDIKRIDISKLDGIVEWFDDLLHKYQSFTHMSDKRIHLLCVLLNKRIKKLKDLIESA